MSSCGINMFANALVIPHFGCASSVRSNCSATNQAHLPVRHNRTILSTDIRTPIDNLLCSTNWIGLSIDGLTTCIFLAANLWNNVPPSICTELDHLTLYHFKTNVIASSF